MLPDTVDATVGAPLPTDAQAHVETCLRCQAELARYRRLLRALQMLRTRYLEPAPGLLAQTLASLETPLMGLAVIAWWTVTRNAGGVPIRDVVRISRSAKAPQRVQVIPQELAA